VREDVVGERARVHRFMPRCVLKLMALAAVARVEAEFFRSDFCGIDGMRPFAEPRSGDAVGLAFDTNMARNA